MSEQQGVWQAQEITSPFTERVYELCFYTVTIEGGTGQRREQEGRGETA